MLRVGLDATSHMNRVAGGIQRFVANLLERVVPEDAEVSRGLDVRPLYRLSRFRQRARRHAGTLGRARWTWQHDSVLRRYDVAHGLDVRVPGPIAKVRVVTLHDLFSLMLAGYSTKKFVEGRLRRYADVAAHADFVTCDSDYTRRNAIELLGIPEERTRRIWLGVDERFRPEAAATAWRPEFGREPTGDFVLAVGPWDDRKNTHRLVEGFARSELRGHARLVLAGKIDPNRPDVRACLRDNGLEDEVDLLGFVADEALPTLCARALVLCVPSRDEGFGLPVLEGMASGTAVASSRAGSLTEVGGGHAALFDPDDPDELAAALAIAARRGGDALDAARRHAASFTWERCAQEHVALWKELGG
ncbi:MAG: glycosyltransferase family 1 protein [Planctomycetota bacterium]